MDILSMILANNFQWVRSQDFISKINGERKVVEIKSSDIGLNRNSTFTIFYNLYNQLPMIFIEYSSDLNTVPLDISGFDHFESDVKIDEDTGDEYKEIAYTSAALKDVL